MMERLAQKILTLIADVRYTQREIEYLAYQIVYQSPRPILKRVLAFGEAIVYHVHEMEADNDDPR